MMVYVEKQTKKTNPQLPADSLPPSYLAFRFRAGAQQGALWVAWSCAAPCASGRALNAVGSASLHQLGEKRA